MRRIRRWVVFLFLGCGFVILRAHPCTAAERELETGPPPSSTDRIETPLQRTFLAPARKEPLFPSVRQQLKELPPFFADTQLEARFRTYYLRKDRTTDILSEAWAIGGSIYYRSGWLKDMISVEAEAFTSQPVYAPEDRGGTLLLAPGQEGYRVLGVANAKLRYEDIVLTGYRQSLGLPYVNRRDSRMTPNTFEAVTLAREEGRLRFSTGYISRIKRRNADDFISMAEAAGVAKDDGLAYGSLLWQPREDFHVGGSFGIAPDILTGGYVEATDSFAIRDDLRVRLDGQFTYQDGDEQLPQGAFETWNVGLRASSSWEGAMLRLGFVVTGDDGATFSPYGSNPSYVKLMQRTFNQAGEKALLLSLSYDFSHAEVTGLSAIVNFVQGWDGRVLGVRGDAREIDVTLDYRLPPGLGLFRGLWLRLRGSWLDDERTDKNGTDVRAILRYDFPIL
jgi:hypothetical protein